MEPALARPTLLKFVETTCETVHGNPGERRHPPANALVVIEPVDQLRRRTIRSGSSNAISSTTTGPD